LGASHAPVWARRSDAAATPVPTAQTSLARIIEDVNSAINASIGKVFDQMAKTPGFPTDPGFLTRVRNDIAGVIVPVAGMLQSFLANLAGIGNTCGSGVSLPVPTTPTSELPWFAQPSPSQPGWYDPTAGTASRDVHLHVNGQFYGSAADLARVLKPELARLV
jgi:hypothetical protein